MFLRHTQSGDMVEILGLTELADPNLKVVNGRFHAGEELPDPREFSKSELEFPSGESLPRCWLQVDYPR